MNSEKLSIASVDLSVLLRTSKRPAEAQLCTPSLRACRGLAAALEKVNVTGEAQMGLEGGSGLGHTEQLM